MLPLASSVNQPIELDFVWSKSEDQLSALLLGDELSSVALPKQANLLCRGRSAALRPFCDAVPHVNG